MKMNSKLKAHAIDYVTMFAGLMISTLAFNLFLVPNNIAPGGFTGIAQVINSLTGWPIGLITILLNAPLFIISARNIGLKFVIKSIIATILFSFLIEILNFGIVMNDLFLASIYGGLTMGVGLGLILRVGATTGGTDLAARLLHEKFPIVNIGWVLFGVDFLVVVLVAFVYDTKAAMYSLVALFLATKAIDFVIDGFDSGKAFFIISNKSEQISDRILVEMDRGVTGLKGKGMYSGDDKYVLLCVVNRMEVIHLKRIVREVDDKAFVIATDVQETIGEGFLPHK